jgi:hypothetical protein
MTRMPADSAAFHERLTSSEPAVKVSSDKTFGIVFAVFLAVIGSVPAIRGGAPRWWAFGASALFLIAAFARPAVLHPLNLMWAKLAILLHHIVSPVAMALVFFLAFTPTGAVLRLFGKDLLRLRRDPEAGSYWIPRDPPGPKPETMIQQF